MAPAQRLHRSGKCSYCLEEDATMRCTKCKAVFYCDKKCQRRGWKLHKNFCSDDPAMRPVILVEHAVERVLEAKKANQVRPPSDVHCFICLEGGDGLLSQGCACRGTSGFVHPDCIEKMAASLEDPFEAFTRHTFCATCDHGFSGVLKVVLLRKYWRSHRLSSNDDARRHAAGMLTMMVLSFADSPDVEAVKYLRHEQLRGLSETHPSRVSSLVEQAAYLYSFGRFDEALELLQATYPKVKLDGGTSVLCRTSPLMAETLLCLRRFKEALPFAAEAVAMAEHSLMEPDLVHIIKACYARALAENGRLQEAMAIFNDELEYHRRVYGPNHELCQALQHHVAHYSSRISPLL